MTPENPMACEQPLAAGAKKTASRHPNVLRIEHPSRIRVQMQADNHLNFNYPVDISAFSTHRISENCNNTLKVGADDMPASGSIAHLKHFRLKYVRRN